LIISIQLILESRYGRKILQANSSFDASQPAFIALLCVIAVLTVILVITIIILCYRYYSHRERILKKRYKSRRKLLSTPINQQLTAPISATPTSASSYSVRSSERLFSNRHQTSSINTLPSRRIQQSMIDAYLDDLNTFQPTTMNVKQLNSYLFIDLHSTSSETFPDNVSKQFTINTATSGYNTSTEGETRRKQQRRQQSTLALKKSYTSRFLMRERTLSNNLHTLPQLRQMITEQQRRLFGLNDTNNSSSTIINDDLQSTNISTTTDDYEDSHAYHVNQKQIIQTMKERKTSIIQENLPHSTVFHYEQEPYLFEIVSTSPGDDSDLRSPYQSIPVINNGPAYINDSIIV
jgi:hypothetical protein